MKRLIPLFLLLCLPAQAAPVDLTTTMWNVTVDSRYPPKVYFFYTDLNGEKMCQWVDLSKPVKPLRTNGLFFMLNHYQGENTAEDWKICYPQ